MKIGISIENQALLTNATGEKKEILLAKYNNLEGFLTFLSSKGVKSIEIRKLVRRAGVEDYKESIQLIWDFGMEITIHGDITGDLAYNSFFEVYPSMDYILKNFHKHQENIIIPIHAYQSNNKETTNDELKKKTVEQLGSWVHLIEREGLPIYIALENNRKKDNMIDPGNSVQGVINMVNEINSKHLGICWDMGHSYSNLMKESGLNTLPEDIIDTLPPISFLKKVYHTHIHGLNDNGKTHFPLNAQNSLPLEKYVSAIENEGYGGVYNLELSFSRWSDEELNDDTITETINRLKKADTCPVNKGFVK